MLVDDQESAKEEYRTSLQGGEFPPAETNRYFGGERSITPPQRGKIIFHGPKID